jgi:hypothetical protein
MQLDDLGSDDLGSGLRSCKKRVKCRFECLTLTPPDPSIVYADWETFKTSMVERRNAPTQEEAPDRKVVRCYPTPLWISMEKSWKEVISVQKFYRITKTGGFKCD